MKIAAFFLLVSGWLLVLAALALLPSFATRAGFACTGLLVELFGLGLAIRSHMPLGEARE